jgi:hypothetical protein
MDKFVVLSHPADIGNSGCMTRIVEVEKDKTNFIFTIEVQGQKQINRLSRKAIEELIVGLDLLLGD